MVTTVFFSHAHLTEGGEGENPAFGPNARNPATLRTSYGNVTRWRWIQ